MVKVHHVGDFCRHSSGDVSSYVSISIDRLHRFLSLDPCFVRQKKTNLETTEASSILSHSEHLAEICA